MAEPILVDFIELHARGISNIDEELKKLKGSMAEAESAHEKLLDSLNDPTYRKKIGELVELKKHESDLARAERSRLDTARQAAALQGRMRDVESGQFGKQLQTQAGLARLDATVRDAERRAELRYKYGRFGGTAMAGMQDMANSRGGRLASAAGTGLFASAMSGFSNTVEMNRLGVEFKLISRELAGALLPTIQKVTKAMEFVRRQLEGMGESGQNVLQAFMFIGAARFAYGRMGGLVGAIAPSLGTGAAAAAGSRIGGGAVAGAVGTGAAAVAGGTLASRAAGGAAAGGAGATAATTAGTAAKSGGVGAALGKGGAIGAAALAFGGLAFNAFSSPKGGAENFESLGMGRKTANWANLATMSASAALPFSMVNDAIHNRRIAPLRLAGLGADALGMESTGRWLGGESHAPHGYGADGKPLTAAAAAALDAAGGTEDRRRVTPAGAGFDAIGTGYERMANTAANTYAGERGSADSGLVSAILRLTDVMGAVRGEEARGADTEEIMRLRGRR